MVVGGLISSSFSHGWKKSTGLQQLIDKKTEASFKMAEKSEFISKNYRESISLYKEALASSAAPQDHALLYSRIGRCFSRLGDYKNAIDEYKKIDDIANITISNVPVSVIALSQITDCYKAMKAEEEHYSSALELYKLLLDKL
jgi:tetratricopeptide (TPR) repeat protein